MSFVQEFCPPYQLAVSPNCYHLNPTWVRLIRWQCRVLAFRDWMNTLGFIIDRSRRWVIEQRKPLPLVGRQIPIDSEVWEVHGAHDAPA